MIIFVAQTLNVIWLWFFFCGFFQAVEEVNRNNIRAEGRLYELKALQDAKKASEYLALARTLPGYGDVVFPHCACDSRKEGHVIPAVGELAKCLWQSIYWISACTMRTCNCSHDIQLNYN